MSQTLPEGIVEVGPAETTPTVEEDGIVEIGPAQNDNTVFGGMPMDYKDPNDPTKMDYVLGYGSDIAISEGGKWGSMALGTAAAYFINPLVRFLYS